MFRCSCGMYKFWMQKWYFYNISSYGSSENRTPDHLRKVLTSSQLWRELVTWFSRREKSSSQFRRIKKMAVNPTHLCEIKMVSLHILQIENFSQNMLLCTTTRKEIHQIFSMAQNIGMETLEWIAEAKKWCGIIGRMHSWHWPVDEGVDSDQFPTLEGQSLLSDTTLVPNNSNPLTLHPHLSTQLPGFVTPPPPEYSEEECAEEHHQILSALSAM